MNDSNPQHLKQGSNFSYFKFLGKAVRFEYIPVIIVFLLICFFLSLSSHANDFLFGDIRHKKDITPSFLLV